MTQRIRPAAALLWLGLALATHARAADLRERDRKLATASDRFLVLPSFNSDAVLDNANEPVGRASVRIEGDRLSLRVERMPLAELIASINAGGRTTVMVRGDAAGTTISDRFEDTDLGLALRRVLSARSHLLIDRRSGVDPRVLEVILLPPTPAIELAPMSARTEVPTAESSVAAIPASQDQAAALNQPLVADRWSNGPSRTQARAAADGRRRGRMRASAGNAQGHL